MKSIIFYSLAFLIQTYQARAQNWQPLGVGMDYNVAYIFSDTTDNILYVSGRFKFADTVQVNAITIWDGCNFLSVGGGIDNCINSCPSIWRTTRYKDQIYTSLGSNVTIDGQVAKGLIKWNGINWSSVGQYGLTDGDQQIGGIAYDYVINDNKLHIFGNFLFAEQDSAFGAAVWDGVTLQSLNFPFHSYGIAIINDAAIFEGDIYVGGNFGDAPGLNHTLDIARFDGENWYPVAERILGGNDDIGAMEVFHNELYIGGNFKKSSGNAANGIMKLQNGHWVDVGGSFESENGVVQDMVVFKDELYVFGSFNDHIGDVAVQNIAKWNGERWCSLGSEIDGLITTSTVLNDSLYIGGYFRHIDGQSFNYIAKWVGGNYASACGPVVNAPFLAKSPDDFQLYPNPASETLHLAWLGGESTPASLMVVNALGQVLLQERIDLAAGGREIDVSGWPPGLYLVQIESAGRTTTRKIVIQR